LSRAEHGMASLPLVSGWSAYVDVTRKDDWLADVVESLNTVAILTPEALDTGYGADVILVGADDAARVRKLIVSKIPSDCKLKEMGSSTAGIVISFECKNASHLEAKLAKWPGRVAIQAKQDLLNVLIRSLRKPKKRELADLVRSDPRVKSIRQLKVTRNLFSLDDIIEIHPFKGEIPDLLLSGFDQKDLEIGRALLGEGYFRVPRPRGLSLDLLASKVQLTKPALLPRMRRLMEASVRQMLGIEEVPEESLKAAHRFFMKGRKRS